MFHYLENKDMESSMRQNSGVIMRTLCSTLKKQYGIGARPFMLGSGRRKLITRNGAGPVDLDYNLEILKCPPLKDWKELKKKVQLSFNHALEVNGQKDCKKSTSVLTAHISTQGKTDPVHYSIDVCVVRKNKKGHYDRLILEKHECVQKDRCYWNEAPDSTELLEKVEYIKSQDRWIRLKEEYLNRKNHYLRSNDHNHPSFICYVEAVNNVYNEIEGGNRMSKKCSGNNHTQAQMNHHANQCNPNSAAHKAAADNHANQCNPNHAASKGK